MTLFDDISGIFDASVIWPKRLAHEAPFYRRLFQQHAVNSVLDAACGPGHHAAMFHQWGLQVQGADLSPAMIERAKVHHGSPPGLAWVVRGYETGPSAVLHDTAAVLNGTAAVLDGTAAVFDDTAPVFHGTPAVFDDAAAVFRGTAAVFDAVICVGNSLALASSPAAVRSAIGSMLAATRKILVLHLANMAAWPEKCLWQKCLHADLPQGPATIIKGVHRSGPRPFIELLVLTGVTAPTLQTESVELLGLEAADLAAILHAAGAAHVLLFGGYQGEPYDRNSSTDLILVAIKATPQTASPAAETPSPADAPSPKPPTASS